MAIYSLAQTPKDSDVDAFIERLRKARVAEEQVKRKQRAKEQEQKLLYDKVQLTSRVTPSYDIGGKAVSVQQVKAFPSLIPTCTNKINHQKKTAVKEEVKRVRDFVSLMLPKSVKKEPNKPKAEQYTKQFAIYDAIVPAAGVTFTEHGKAPKSNSQVLSSNTHRTPKANSLQPKAMEDKKGEMKEVIKSPRVEVKVPNSTVKATVSGNIGDLLVCENRGSERAGQSCVPGVYRSQRNLALGVGKSEAQQANEIFGNESPSSMQNTGRPIKRHLENINRFSYAAFLQINGTNINSN
eukprot:TRINITY_DN5097_c0_g1_i2.p1 TRINITY_DN5097_c0_g1~~TRINITY_DN5097_c0_g1_i2.p1  ORF type:complete len:295 (-),score=51.41 TRINITY_DN5097_c0_g1_i2:158-1042(-)